MAKRTALGKGLKALIPDGEGTEELVSIEISLIKPSPNQPRITFDEESLRELARSIEESGVLQPIIVREVGDSYQLVVGERRYRAAKIVGLETIPAIIKDLSDREATQIALIENIHREDLNPIEEATAYRNLMDEFDLKQEDVAGLVGRSRSYIANSVRLLSLPDIVKKHLIEGKLTIGHARALLSFGDEKIIAKLARRIIKDQLTVRDIEELSRTADDEDGEDEKEKSEEKAELDLELEFICENLQKILSRKVKIFYNEGKGRIVMEFYSDDDFNNLLKRLGYKGRR